MRINFARLSSTARMPIYATSGAAGLDLFADQDAHLAPGESRLIVTNIAMELPDGFEAQVRPRSGLALKHRITVLNSPGTIDPDYRGGIGVILHNAGDNPFIVKPGDRIAQLVVTQFHRVTLDEVEEVIKTVRGAGGFGSTGMTSTADTVAQLDDGSQPLIRRLWDNAVIGLVGGVNVLANRLGGR